MSDKVRKETTLPKDVLRDQGDRDSGDSGYRGKSGAALPQG
jgi:hypothetical protein